MKKSIVTVAGVAMLGLLTLGCVKVVKMNTEANEANASVVMAEELEAEPTIEQRLEVTTEDLESKKAEKNVVKVEDKEIVENKDDVKTEKSTKDAKKIEEAKAKASKYDEYFKLNGVTTPEEIAAMGPDEFRVSDAEWAKAKAQWMELNPEYSEDFAEHVRGEYETAKWYEILEYYGIREADNEKGYEYIKDASVENYIYEEVVEAPEAETIETENIEAE